MLGPYDQQCCTSVPVRYYSVTIPSQCHAKYTAGGDRSCPGLSKPANMHVDHTAMDMCNCDISIQKLNKINRIFIPTS